MKKAIKDFFSSFNEEYTFKFWALVALIAAVLLMIMGITELAMYQTPIQFTGAAAWSPSVVSGWVTTSLGLAFMAVSWFGVKVPKKNLSKGKIKAQGRR